ncbi:MAG: multidrug transporter [Gammaproteobacteria bacterium RIFCSPHIGHO2_12_FULL_45_9]|nr:MAG: multidrug transporter [Gammaproteobacteria bacterium RIFCSPHIGHO2_12_FULL_45_9]
MLLAGILALYHLFSYVLPMTDDAFVVTNVSPVAADVAGFITHIDVKNGQAVKKGDPIFTVYQPPYRFAYEQAVADYQAGQRKISVLQKQIEETEFLIKATRAELKKAQYELSLKQARSVMEAVSKLEVKKLVYDVETLQNKVVALEKKVSVLQAEILQQYQVVASLKAKMGDAKINLDLTVVRAPGDGVIDNMYVSENTPIKMHEPVFAFINTSNYYVQANFDETDLRHVRVGDTVYIMLRMYYFDKIFHGKVVNTLFAAERQATAHRSQIQLVDNENEWLLLPQRFPVQIKILDPDPRYPLHPGSSAYVYIKTRR